MHRRRSRWMERALVASSFLAVTAGVASARGDDDGFLSRLFRGGSSSSSASSSAARPGGNSGSVYGQSAGTAVGGGQAGSPYPGSNFGGLTSQGPVTTPPNAGSAPGQRLSPRPRVSPPVTNADPLLTRLALGDPATAVSLACFSRSTPTEP